MRSFPGDPLARVAKGAAANEGRRREGKKELSLSAARVFVFGSGVGADLVRKAQASAAKNALHRWIRAFNYRSCGWMGGSGASLPAGGARVCKKRVELGGGRERKRGGWFVRYERWGGTTKMVSFPIRAQARVVTGALSLFSGVCVWGSKKTRKEGVCVVAGGGGESRGFFFGIGAAGPLAEGGTGTTKGSPPDLETT